MKEPRDSSPNAVFITGVGRSGTHFLAELLKYSSNIGAYHLDDLQTAVADSFTFFTQWYRLPVDTKDLTDYRGKMIEQAFSRNRIYAEANPYLAMSISTLREAFNSVFIFVTRNPVDVVNSHYVKGWFAREITYPEAGKIAGYDYNAQRPNHYFGRIHPLERQEFERWIRLTRIGKLAWMWNAINMRITEQLAYHPNYLHIKLENFNYEQYIGLNKFIGCSAPLKEKKLQKIVEAKPGRGKMHKTIKSWTKKETEEFYNETKAARDSLGYK